jgi:hypothetical protein
MNLQTREQKLSNLRHIEKNKKTVKQNRIGIQELSDSIKWQTYPYVLNSRNENEAEKYLKN